MYIYIYIYVNAYVCIYVYVYIYIYILPTHRIKKELSICQSVLCLDLVSFPVLRNLSVFFFSWQATT